VAEGFPDPVDIVVALELRGQLFLDDLDC